MTYESSADETYVGNSSFSIGSGAGWQHHHHHQGQRLRHQEPASPRPMAAPASVPPARRQSPASATGSRATPTTRACTPKRPTATRKPAAIPRSLAGASAKTPPWIAPPRKARPSPATIPTRTRSGTPSSRTMVPPPTAPAPTWAPTTGAASYTSYDHGDLNGHSGNSTSVSNERAYYETTTTSSPGPAVPRSPTVGRPTTWPRATTRLREACW